MIARCVSVYGSAMKKLHFIHSTIKTQTHSIPNCVCSKLAIKLLYGEVQPGNELHVGPERANEITEFQACITYRCGLHIPCSHCKDDSATSIGFMPTSTHQSRCSLHNLGGISTGLPCFGILFTELVHTE